MKAAPTPVIHMARTQAKPGRETELARRLAEVTAASQREPGCIAYEWLQERSATDGSANTAVFHSYEVWASQEALDEHLQTPHFQRFFQQEGADPTLASAPVDYTLEPVVQGASAMRGTEAVATLTHHTAMTKRGRIHYVKAGQGEPMLLIHGFPQTWYEWRHVIPLLAPHFTLIAMDLPGFGDSSAPAGGLDARSVAEDLHELVTQLGYPSVHLVGHDIGNLVAYAYAASYRQETGRLVALEAVLPGAGLEPLMQPTAERNLWHFGFHMSGSIAEALVDGRERLYIEHFLREFAYDPSVFDDSDVAEYVRGLSKPGAKRTAFGYFGAIFQNGADNQRWMQEKLSQPVLALGGDRSLGAFGVASYQQVAMDVRGGSVANCGHWIPEERPTELANAVLEFFGKA